MKVRLAKRLAVALALVMGILALPLVAGAVSPAAAAPCELSGDLSPEVVGGGLDGLLQPPAPGTPAQTPATNYAQFGTSGQFWHTYDLGCDFGAMIGNAWANVVFLWAKAIDRLTISTYQAAATEGPLDSIKNVVDDIITNLSNALYWPFLTPLVLLAAIWLAWYGLLRKRASMSVEGVIWMVLAVTIATWFFNRPGDFTSLGKVVTDKTGEVVNSAFSGLPGADSPSCLPQPGQTAAEIKGGGFAGPKDAPTVERNADALWSTLVCKPWLMGLFGTADPDQAIVRDYGRKILEHQTIDQAELAARSTNASAAQAAYADLAEKLRDDPRHAIFTGKDWTSRLGVAIGALIAALVAGVLIFLVAVSLLVLKVGFLLLLIMGPVFLLIGVHPGSGRIIAMRWVEMLVGTLLRQAVLALVLGVLVYGYALIISTAMPWGLQILFIALLTIAVFFYRKPFQHLFASMSGHTLTTRMLGEAASSPILERSANVLPPVAASKIARWGARKAEPVVQAAAAGGTAGATAAAGVAVRAGGRDDGASAGSGTRVPATAAPLNTEQGGGKGVGRAARTGSAPPLNLSGAPTRSGGGPVRPSSGGTPSGGAGASGGGPSGGWFGGRSGGGWASRGGSSGGSRSGGSGGGSSRGGRSSSGGSGGGGSSRRGSSGGGSSRQGSGGGSSRQASGGSSGGGIFGGGSSSGGSFFGSRQADVPRARSSEPPPLWLPSRSSGNGRSGAEPPVPFWLKPNNSDKD
ncbi:type IV secretion system protein [Nonomuraea longicatena]|uniref:TrbL/VirB6 plasmid conjugal transfer protein n=1 Tax=Nonomuraea longicatena TaxID=83682 RepID=A0ABN1R2E8_9ACTN